MPSIRSDSNADSMSQTKSARQYWNEEELPKDEDDLLKLLKGSRFTSGHTASPTETYLSNGADRESEPQYSECSFSFGHNGTTATVNASGQLMQFGRYLGTGHSGMFSADQITTREPYRVLLRAHDIDKLARTRDPGDFSYGLRFDESLVGEPVESIKRDVLSCRWPRYQFQYPSSRLTIQWIIHGSFVVQRCTIQSDAGRTFNLSFSKNMALRDLDSIDEKYKFNKVDEDKDRCGRGPAGFSWTWVRKFGVDPHHPSTPDGFAGVGVVVSIFMDGTPCKWTDDAQWVATLKGNNSQTSSPSELEIVVAYRMIGVNNSMHCTDFLTSIDETGVDNLLCKPSHLVYYGVQTSSNKPDHESTTREDARKSRGIPLWNPPVMGGTDLFTKLNYFAFRHLEHILSVCAIPTSTSEQKDVAYAITCGDVSGHVICPSASLFAFRYLLAAAGHLRLVPERDEYQQSLLYRIKAVCLGHLLWLRKADAVDFENHGEQSHHPNGRAAKPESQGSASGTQSPAAAAFQIIKTVEFFETYREGSGLVIKVLEKISKPWVSHLHDSDKRGKCAWVHSQDEGYGTYRLDDHIWICEALKRLQQFFIWDQGRDSADAYGSGKFKIRFAHEHVLKEVLEWFTTGATDSSFKKMLAVTRSLRDSRFLLHARDTVLFYASDDADLSSIEACTNTIQAQAHYVNNDEASWDNSLRYGLAIVMAARGHSINNRAPQEMFQVAVDTLLKAIHYNGFIPGQLNSSTKMPTLFSRPRDAASYYHASFEVPFILLSHRDHIIARSGASHDNVSKTHQTKRKSARKTPQTQQRRSSTINEQVPREVYLETQAPRSITSLKKKVPFRSRVDSSNIADLDNEWLFNLPQCFLRNQELRFRHSFYDTVQQFSISNEAAGEVVARALQSQSLLAEFSIQGRFDRRTNYLIDTPKRKHAGRRYGGEDTLTELLSLEGFWDAVKSPRTIQEAKKRIILLTDADDLAALICYMASSESEKPATALFLDRHAQYENFFSEDIDSDMNTWNAQLHLSFYVMMNSSHQDRRGIPTSYQERFPHPCKKILSRASVGFRIDGDFFDRYWTCWIVDYTPNATPGLHPKLRGFINGNPNDRSSRQRRIMELMFLDFIVSRILEATNDVVDTVSSELKVQNEGSASLLLQKDAFSDSESQWQTYRRILQIMHNNLEHVMATIDDWQQREKSRGSEKPRWTKNDERKYRATINKMQGKSNLGIRELTKSMASVRSLIEKITSSQERAERQRNFKESRNVLYFTYVTVVFQPLGFATGLFSMSGSPDGLLVTSMATCAVVAFAITIWALVNAAALLKLVRSWRFGLNRVALELMRFQSRTLRAPPRSSDTSIEGAKSTETPTNEHNTTSSSRQAPVRITSETNTTKPPPTPSSIVSSLTTYFFIVIPARQLILGANAAREGVKSWKEPSHMIGAIAVLPILVLILAVRLAFYMPMDMLHLGYETFLSLFSSVSPDHLDKDLQDPFDEKHELGRIMRLLDIGRPLQSVYRSLREKRKERELRGKDPAATMEYLDPTGK